MRNKWAFFILFLIFIPLVMAVPLINFVDPTLDSDVSTTNTSIEINVSIEEENLDELIYNWDGTNYTYYNDSLVLMMNFDNVSALGENDTYVVDVSNYSNNGTVYNGAVYSASGKYGGTYDFDGSNDYINIADNSALNVPQKATFSVWIYPTEYGDAGDVYIKNIYSDEDTDLTAVWRLGSQGSAALKDKFGVNYNNGANNDIESTGTIPLNTWTHVTTVTDGTNIHFYFNGVLDSSKAYSITPTQKSLDWMIGTKTETGSTSRQFKGLIDEIRLWNRPFSANEVYQQYISNLNKFNSTQWYLYVNQSLNSTTGLREGDYTYFVSAKNSSGSSNQTETRTVTISSDITYPIFSSYWDNNASLVNSGIGLFNVTIEDTNGSVLLEINNTNITATNLTANVYNVSYNFTSNGSYPYIWHSWGNGTSANYNSSETRSYTVNATLVDTDNDGISDDSDPLLYNETNVTTSGVAELNITVGGNSTNESFSGVQEILFYDQNDLMINFSHNFTLGNLDLSKIVITKSSTSLIVNLSGQLQGNKTLYIVDNSFVSLCVKDEEVESIDNVSSSCDGSNETDFTNCLGGSLSDGGINCTDEGSIIKIENLQYSAIKGTQATYSGSPGGGGGRGGGSRKKESEEFECTSNSECPADKSCYNNECVKLFDVKVIDVDSPVGKDGFLGFTYFVKGIANISGDVIINFWLKQEKEIVSSGQDTIYLGSFEEKKESTKIFIPQNLSTGSYEFYIQVTFENYQATAHRTVFVEQDDDIEVSLKGSRIQRPFSFNQYLFFIALLLVLTILLSVMFFWEKKVSREKIKVILNNLKRVKEKPKPEVKKPRKTIKGSSPDLEDNKNRALIKGLLKAVLIKKKK